MEQRVGKKIQKWDEVNGTVTETVDVAVEVPGEGKANPIRSLEDQIEQNDNIGWTYCHLSSPLKYVTSFKMI